ncbi:MAG: hypothetical protein KKG33_08410 [candidate division Zixibacteria bacterium]|nr:hypothetical protein [candidate division Zixibacteria bacterium]MBU1469501.1 hypothetical protein [candidate division Zixibacteria bacterium]MBU2625568.1 hypothetical protein [candidate division Zixibacteria bacterium]
MKSAYITLVCALLISMYSCALAETAIDKTVDASSATSIGSNRYESKFSLLDPSRFSMQHSYSVVYSSVGGTGQTIGLYMNSMRYQVSNSLDVNVALGWYHQPGTMFSNSNRGTTDYGTILPNVQILYQPSEKFRLMIGFESLPGVFSNGRDHYYSPFGAWSY